MGVVGACPMGAGSGLVGGDGGEPGGAGRAGPRGSRRPAPPSRPGELHGREPVRAGRRRRHGHALRSEPRPRQSAQLASAAWRRDLGRPVGRDPAARRRGERRAGGGTPGGVVREPSRGVAREAGAGSGGRRGSARAPSAGAALSAHPVRPRRQARSRVLTGFHGSHPATPRSAARSW